MTTIKTFHDFEAFKKAREFTKEVGRLTHSGRFAHDKVLVTQCRKALLSVLSNFAEGFERDGNQEFVQFLSISKGSLGEIRAQLVYALDQEYIDEQSYSRLDELGSAAARLNSGLIAHLRRSQLKGRKFRVRSPRING
ncbi:MAG: four helix bundle protein [Chthoniobacterales bacterium]